MKKSKKTAVAILLLLVAGIGGYLLLTSAHRAPMQVVGTLTPKEVAEITSAVHHQMWRSTFPDFSWKTFQRLPGALARNVTAHITGIYGDSQSAVVLVANSKGRKPSLFMAQKMEKGWVCGGGFP